MPLTPPPDVDTRPLFRPVASALTDLLRELPPDDWARHTLAGSWTVRDLVAHLTDLALRRVSFHRDAYVPPPPPFPIAGPRDFVRFINRINHDWVAAFERLSPRVLTDLFHLASADLAGFFEGHPLEAQGLFGVSWAGEHSSSGWFDIGREFTELWHHQMQIRLAVGAPPLADARYLDAVLAVGMRALPFAYRDVAAVPGEAICLIVEGATPGAWTLERTEDAWRLWAGQPNQPSVSVRIAADTAWRLLFNALPSSEASAIVADAGRADLTTPLLGVRSIVI